MLSLRERLLVYGLENYEVNDIIRIVSKEYLDPVHERIKKEPESYTKYSLGVDYAFQELKKALTTVPTLENTSNRPQEAKPE
jgi:hypothetical protein